MNSARRRCISIKVLSLLLARVLYSANWFNIGSVFFLMALDLKQNISMLGLVTSSFIVGVGLFQVPAGILAAKYGAGKIAVVGILLASFCALLTGLSVDITQLAALRFMVGIGMACFFGPSVILISKYLGKGSEGLGIGLINSAHAIGGIIGIFAWVVLAQLTSWRISLLIGGALGLLTGLILVIALSRRDTARFEVDTVVKSRIAGSNTNSSGLRQTIFSKSLIILGLNLLSFQAGSSIILTFVVFYLAGTLRIDYTIAGFIGSLNLIIALFFSPIFGRMYDRTREAKKILIISGFAAMVSVWGMAVPSIYVIIPSMIISATFLSAGFVIVYAEAKRSSVIYRLDPQYQTLAVSYVNGISLFGAFWIPILFSFAVNHFGFAVAWFLAGLIVFTFILPAFKLK